MYFHAPCAAGCGGTYVDSETGLCERRWDEERRAAGLEEEEDL